MSKHRKNASSPENTEGNRSNVISESGGAASLAEEGHTETEQSEEKSVGAETVDISSEGGVKEEAKKNADDENALNNNTDEKKNSPLTEEEAAKTPLGSHSEKNATDKSTSEEEKPVAPETVAAVAQKPVKFNINRHIVAASILTFSLLVLLIGRFNQGFADWFCSNVYPVFSGIGSHIWGIFPFSAAEIFVVLVILGAICGLVVLVIRVIKHKGSRIKTFFNCFSWAEIFAAAVFLTVTFNCLINYYRTPFSEYSGLSVRKYTVDELREFTLDLIEKANEVAEKVDLDEEGRPVKPYEFNKYAVEAMEKLGEKYPVLDVYYPQPKGVAASGLMSSFNLAGIYFPVTVEANFNTAMPVSSQGFTACHELSHLSGFIREDEANFIAFIACRGSSNTFFKYSGYLGALTYSLNALYSAVSQEEYAEVCSRVSPVILNEFSYRNEYWSPYQKKVTYKVSTVINDTYLKANNQSDGIKSYGRMVDLMLAEYFGE